MRIGLFGGSFDPPHIGHLLVAGDAVEELGLDRLVFIPAARQPLKVGRQAAPPEARLEMVRLAIAGDDRFACDPQEIERPGLSYTVDTLADYAQREPTAERFFLIGVDAVRALSEWKEPDRVATLARLAILQRGGDQAAGEGGEDDIRAVVARMEAWTGAARSPVVLRTRRVDVSSTEVRERVQQGKSIRGFVTDAVACYIEVSGLYR